MIRLTIVLIVSCLGAYWVSADSLKIPSMNDSYSLSIIDVPELVSCKCGSDVCMKREDTVDNQ